MILDACCGPKYWYRGLHEQFSDEELVFMDTREGQFSTHGRRETEEFITIEPTKVGSITAIPWPDNTFSLILFDPPHDKWGPKSFMRAQYGSWTHEDFIINTYHANKEFHRVLKPGGLVYAKILEHKNRPREPYKWNRPAKLVEQFTNFKLLLDTAYQSQAGKTRTTHLMLFVAKTLVSSGAGLE